MTGDRHRAFAAVEFVCPRGHRLGRAVRQPNGDDLLEQGLVRVDGPNGETKIKARCRRCEGQTKVYRDLQGSGAKVDALLAELDAQPGRGVSRYTLGE